MKKFLIFLFIISNSPLFAQFCYLDKDHDGYGDTQYPGCDLLFLDAQYQIPG